MISVKHCIFEKVKANADSPHTPNILIYFHWLDIQTFEFRTNDFHYFKLTLWLENEERNLCYKILLSHNKKSIKQQQACRSNNYIVSSKGNFRICLRTFGGPTMVCFVLVVLVYLNKNLRQKVNNTSSNCSRKRSEPYKPHLL